jgi:hypothetical protein
VGGGGQVMMWQLLAVARMMWQLLAVARMMWQLLAVARMMWQWLWMAVGGGRDLQARHGVVNVEVVAMAVTWQWCRQW